MRRRTSLTRCGVCAGTLAGLLAAMFWTVPGAGISLAQERKARSGDTPAKNAPPKKPTDKQRAAPKLSDKQWSQLDAAVDRGLTFLSTQQAPNGSFISEDPGQPAVTSFCVMAFLSRGHLPNQGLYGKQISRAVDYVVSTQRSDGLFFAIGPESEWWKILGHYNHGIAGVMLSEVYGTTEAKQQEAVRNTIEKALKYTRQQQDKPKPFADDYGGWRYLLPSQNQMESDLSMTVWHLTFYRAAKNAEFDVPKPHMDEALEYVRRCFNEQRGTFCYGLHDRGPGMFSRGMAGAGIVSLSMGGEHDSEMARRTGKFILDHPFDRFNRGITAEDRFFYSAFYCSQAMYQLGGEYWDRYYAVLLQTMVDNQCRDGSWDREATQQEGQLGLAYSTSLAILSLTPPYQMLPIYQR